MGKISNYDEIKNYELKSQNYEVNSEKNLDTKSEL